MVKLSEEQKRQELQEENAKAQEKTNVAKENIAKASTKNKEDKAKKNFEAKKTEGKEIKGITVNATLEDLGMIFYPLVTEKSVNMIEAENKITFIINDKANREKVKILVEKMYSVKVVKVNIVRDRKGRKKAIVRLAKENKASELATKLIEIHSIYFHDF